MKILRSSFYWSHPVLRGCLGLSRANLSNLTAWLFSPRSWLDLYSIAPCVKWFRADWFDWTSDIDRLGPPGAFHANNWRWYLEFFCLLFHEKNLCFFFAFVQSPSPPTQTTFEYSASLFSFPDSFSAWLGVDTIEIDRIPKQIGVQWKKNVKNKQTNSSNNCEGKNPPPPKKKHFKKISMRYEVLRDFIKWRLCHEKKKLGKRCFGGLVDNNSPWGPMKTRQTQKKTR